MSSADQPKVSVCVVTYNQRDYLGPCLDSLVEQETDFAFEIVVADDCSTDGTREIVRDFARKYPGRIVALLNERNLGPYENYRHVHRAARGAYVAHMDGDDLARPGKLRAQAALLDELPDCPAVFHQMEIVDSAGRLSGKLWPSRAPRRMDADYVLEHHPVFAHSSMMYRRGALDELLSSEGRFVDFLAYVQAALKGDVALIAKPLGRYRLGVGISSENYKWFDAVMAVCDHAERRGIAPAVVARARANQAFQMANNALYLKRYDVFRSLIESSWHAAHISNVQRLMYAFRRIPRLLLLLRAAYVSLRDVGIAPELDEKFSS